MPKSIENGPLRRIMSPNSAERSDDFPEPTTPTTATKAPLATSHVISRKFASKVGSSLQVKEALLTQIGFVSFSSCEIWKKRFISVRGK